MQDRYPPLGMRIAYVVGDHHNFAKMAPVVTETERRLPGTSTASPAPPNTGTGRSGTSSSESRGSSV
jgi:hypothetical protein